uniref:Lysine--tRNA ligase n=1 Tax=candidate division WOR-3 bacterium TaxID=2052148 RepID=A0A7C3Z227_UNCW3
MENMEKNELDQIRFRKEKLQKLKEMGINPYPYSFKRTHYSQDIKNDFANFENKDVRICGRIKTKRMHGKAGFFDIEDDKGKIQVYFRSDILNDKFEIIKLLDLGDFIGVSGSVFKTHTGEITVLSKDITILSKALHPLPEKWHGVKDIELKYRYRYLDLISDNNSKEIFIKRTKIIQLIREFFIKEGFIEVETPILQPVYGGALAKPFKTMYNVLKREYYLRIANELYLKRLVIGGMEKVFEMGKMFRNEGLDRFHNPEFTNLEAYWAYADYFDVMELVEKLFTHLLSNLFGERKIKFQGEEIVFPEKWERARFFDIIKEETGVDFMKLDFEGTKRKAEEIGVKTEGKFTKGKILDAVFDKFVKPHLLNPIFIMDYPIDISPLAKRHRENPELVERFEPFIARIEVGNAYSELNDPEDQKERFKFQIELRKKGDLETESFDEDFINAMSYGMPPMGGLGLGIDRIVMLLLDADSIRDVILFPQLKE